jgi:hypothetical protein
MARDLVTFTTFSTAEEAYVFRNLLEAGGVPAFVAEDATVTWFWYFGTALGGVKVQVAEEDVELARQLLAEEPASTGDLTAQTAGSSSDLSEECAGEGDLLQAAAGDDDFPPEKPGDVLANRAFRAALFGIVACPPLLLLYSLAVLLRLGLSEHEVSQSQRWKPMVAFVIDVLVLSFILSILLGNWWLY